MHLFLTEPGFHTPRWQNAFPGASVVQSADQAAQWAAKTHPQFAWVLTGTKDWERQVAAFARHGSSVIAMTRNPAMDELRVALGQGARGYVHAVSAPVLLRQAAEVVQGGGMWLPPEVVNGVVRALSGAASGSGDMTSSMDAALAGLSDRERAVAEAVATGLSNKEVARRLGITERTVKAHLSAVFRKLGLRDRMQLAVRLRAAPQPDRDVG